MIVKSYSIHLRALVLLLYGGFLKWWYPTTMGFPTKIDHFAVFWGYHHLRQHPYTWMILMVAGIQGCHWVVPLKIGNLTGAPRGAKTSTMVDKRKWPSCGKWLGCVTGWYNFLGTIITGQITEIPKPELRAFWGEFLCQTIIWGNLSWGRL